MMAIIIRFPGHKTTIPLIHPVRKEEKLIRYPLKPSVSEKIPDWEEQKFETELEKVRAKCILQQQDENSHKIKLNIISRLVLSISKGFSFFNL
jgi:hypothetical protein